MSPDKCPVCGSKFVGDEELIEWDCGKSESFGRPCPNAERVAIERAAEIERLRTALERIAEQGPYYGPDGTHKTWKHWAKIARETLNETKGET
jgi:hypothetical protein